MNKEIACKKTITLFETFCTNLQTHISKHDKQRTEFNNTEETSKNQQCGQRMQFIMDNCIGIVDYPYPKDK